jgi:hypothetical protein
MFLSRKFQIVDFGMVSKTSIFAELASGNGHDLKREKINLNERLGVVKDIISAIEVHHQAKYFHKGHQSGNFSLRGMKELLIDFGSIKTSNLPPPSSLATLSISSAIFDPVDSIPEVSKHVQNKGGVYSLSDIRFSNHSTHRS